MLVGMTGGSARSQCERTSPVLRGPTSSERPLPLRGQPGTLASPPTRMASSSAASCLLPAPASQKPLPPGRNEQRRAPAHVPIEVPGRGARRGEQGRRTAPPHSHRPQAGTGLCSV